MKKLLSLLLVALMLVGLMAGCGTTETTTSNPPADDGGEVSAPPADDTAPDVELGHSADNCRGRDDDAR